MSSVSLLQALRRFFASIAYPKWILCDNAKPFHVINELQTSINEEEQIDPDVMDFCAQRKIEFKFIPSFSPWQGGLYEKMIHIFKVSFKHALNNRILKLEELRTLAKETETIVNNRPSHLPVEENDQITPLRPMDFLHPWTTLSLPRVNEETSQWEPSTTTKENLLEVWKSIDSMLNRFWRRWTSEYLTSLREHYCMTHPPAARDASTTPDHNKETSF
ncbi:hypothetical protein OSTOST_04517 [Ostertagia ostertagi]